MQTAPASALAPAEPPRCLSERLASVADPVACVSTEWLPQGKPKIWQCRWTVPLLPLEDAGILDLTVDGADEVDPDLNLIKGYGRALIREKIVAASSRRLVILVGDEKLVTRLGTRGKLPVEVVPFALPLCLRRLRQLRLDPVPFESEKGLFVTENGNHILDCRVTPIPDPARLEMDLRAIPGVVGTGLFLGMADTVLFGDRRDFRIVEERDRGVRHHGCRRENEPVQKIA